MFFLYYSGLWDCSGPWAILAWEDADWSVDVEPGLAKYLPSGCDSIALSPSCPFALPLKLTTLFWGTLHHYLKIFILFVTNIPEVERTALWEMHWSRESHWPMCLLIHTRIHLAAGTGLGTEGSSGNRPRLLQSSWCQGHTLNYYNRNIYAVLWVQRGRRE